MLFYGIISSQISRTWSRRCHEGVQCRQIYTAFDLFLALEGTRRNAVGDPARGQIPPAMTSQGTTNIRDLGLICSAHFVRPARCLQTRLRHYSWWRRLRRLVASLQRVFERYHQPRIRSPRAWRAMPSVYFGIVGAENNLLAKILRGGFIITSSTTRLRERLLACIGPQHASIYHDRRTTWGFSMRFRAAAIEALLDSRAVRPSTFARQASLPPSKSTTRADPSGTLEYWVELL